MKITAAKLIICSPDRNRRHLAVSLSRFLLATRPRHYVRHRLVVSFVAV